MLYYRVVVDVCGPAAEHAVAPAPGPPATTTMRGRASAGGTAGLSGSYSVRPCVGDGWVIVRLADRPAGRARYGCGDGRLPPSPLPPLPPPLPPLRQLPPPMGFLFVSPTMIG